MEKIINDILTIINNHKEILLVISAILGWLFAAFQFIMNRKYKKQDRKFEAYSGYMAKADKIMNNISNDPNKILEFYHDCFKEIINNTGDEKKINETLIEFNEKLKYFIQYATEPWMILRQELNQLKIICSTKLLAKIEEMNRLILDYNNAVQKSLSACIPNNINSTVNEMQVLSQNERWHSFDNLNNEILNIMRKEIGS